MDKAAAIQSGNSGAKHQMMDFAPTKSDSKTGNYDAPVPVTSAKAAINAMFAEKSQASHTDFAPSAREIVNASSLNGQRAKSASNLHHGSIQKSMESTRTSASALLRSAKSSDEDVPVIRTSLKLGANARPKQPPVVLPPNARMAQQARPTEEDNGELAVQIITKKKPLPRSRRQVRDPQMLGGGRRSLPVSTKTIELMPEAETAELENPLGAGPNQLAPKAIAAGAKMSSDISAVKPPVKRPAGVMPRTKASTKSAINTMAPRFRSAPKGHAMNCPDAVATDSSYVMSEPPKLNVRAQNLHKDLAELGISEDTTVADALKSQGDRAPIGRMAEQTVAAGHGGAALSEYNTIKSNNTSSYSFSRRDANIPAQQTKTEDKSYKPVDQSAFLRSVSVEKRPLSGGMPIAQISNYGQSDSYQVPGKNGKHSKATKSAKASRKNVYAKKEKPAKQDLPTRPTVIIPSSRRSKAPLFFLVLLTIILGAAVGAAAYLCFFQ